jgi:hypothetical protein
MAQDFLVPSGSSTGTLDSHVLAGRFSNQLFSYRGLFQSQIVLPSNTLLYIS